MTAQVGTHTQRRLNVRATSPQLLRPSPAVPGVRPARRQCSRRHHRLAHRRGRCVEQTRLLQVLRRRLELCRRQLVHDVEPRQPAALIAPWWQCVGAAIFSPFESSYTTCRTASKPRGNVFVP